MEAGQIGATDAATIIVRVVTICYTFWRVLVRDCTCAPDYGNAVVVTGTVREVNVF